MEYRTGVALSAADCTKIHCRDYCIYLLLRNPYKIIIYKKEIFVLIGNMNFVVYIIHLHILYVLVKFFILFFMIMEAQKHIQ